MPPSPITIDPAILLNPNILWVVLVIAILIFAFISLILIYHWIKFSLNPIKASLFTIVYVAISIAIIITTIASLTYYQISY